MKCTNIMGERSPTENVLPDPMTVRTTTTINQATGYLWRAEGLEAWGGLRGAVMFYFLTHVVL